MKTIYYFKENLNNVTEFYYNIIIEALKMNGCVVKELPVYTRALTKNISKDSYFLVTLPKEFAPLYLHGFRHFIYWYQGLVPEENYMIMGDKWRTPIYSYLEKFSLRKAEYKIGVSKYMFQHFEKKYHLKFGEGDYFVMPCFNSTFCERNFHIPGKYDNNIFCYAGGIQPWQGFDDIMQTYKMIEGKYENTSLRIFSKNLKAAKVMLDKYNIKHYTLDSVKQEDMNDALAQCKYGFLLRDNNIVNQVATPTKLATYVGNGVIPIMTSTIRFYADIAEEYPHVYSYDENDKDEVINKALTDKIDAKKLEEEYSSLMDKYFNPQRYIKELRVFFKEI